MAGNKKNRSDVKGNTRLISFKVSHDVYRRLEEHAKTQTDDAGITLNPSTAARRLMNKALDALSKKSS